MKTKNKFVLGGFVLVTMAAIALLMTFGVVGREKGYRTTTMGEKVIEEKTKYTGEHTSSARRFKNLVEVEKDTGIKRDNATVILDYQRKEISISLRFPIINVTLQKWDPYHPLANCIKEGLEEIGVVTTGIVIVPSSGYIRVFYNTAGLVVYNYAPSAIGPLHFIGLSGEYTWVEEVLEERAQGVLIAPEINRIIETFPAEGPGCSLDTGGISNVVEECIDENPSAISYMGKEGGLIFIATGDGFIIFGSDGVQRICRDWLGRGLE